MPGIELMSSCPLYKHLTNWAASPAQYVSKLFLTCVFFYVIIVIIIAIIIGFFCDRVLLKIAQTSPIFAVLLPQTSECVGGLDMTIGDPSLTTTWLEITVIKLLLSYRLFLIVLNTYLYQWCVWNSFIQICFSSVFSLFLLSLCLLVYVRLSVCLSVCLCVWACVWVCFF